MLPPSTSATAYATAASLARRFADLDDPVLYEPGGRYVAAAAFRIASWASFMSSRTVVSTSSKAPPAPTAIASAAADALSGASIKKTPSNSPKAYQKRPRYSGMATPRRDWKKLARRILSHRAYVCNAIVPAARCEQSVSTPE